MKSREAGPLSEMFFRILKFLLGNSSLICSSTCPINLDFSKINIKKNKLYIVNIFGAKSPIANLFNNSMYIKLFLVACSQIITYAQTLRKASLSVVGTYIVIHKNEETLSANLH